MSVIVFAPCLLAGLCALTLGFRHTFGLVTLPALLLLPAYYSHKFSGIPIANFHNYLLGVTFLSLVVGKDRKLLNFDGCDLLVFFYAMLTVISEFQNKGYADAQNLAAVRILGVCIPYAIGKVCGRSNALLGSFLFFAIIISAVIGFVSPFEARLGRNPFDFWRDLWPNAVPWSGSLYRFGLRRVAGPFAHPICFGFYFSMLAPIAIWYFRLQLIRSRWVLFFSSLGLLIGILAAGSRGPWLGALISVTIPLIAWNKDRKAIVLAVIMIIAFVGMLSLDKVAGYVTIERGQAVTQEQETAAYRWEMLDNYLEVVSERPWIGFGKDQIPVVKGLKSIDNQYLFIALMHGLPAAIAFFLCMIVPCTQILIKASVTPISQNMTRLGFALGGTLSGAIFTQTTVFAGTQTEQFLYLFIGIAVSTSRRLERSSQGTEST